MSLSDPIPFITFQPHTDKTRKEKKEKKQQQQKKTGGDGGGEDGEDIGGIFVINKKAVAVLEAIKTPIRVISIAGLYRTGKSYILNQLAGRSDGFEIGSTVEPCTDGIWLWCCKTSPLDDEDLDENDEANSNHGSNKVTTILLDTEGLGSYTKTKTYDVQLFSLSVLLSSLFIYNSLSSIDEGALDRLSLVLQVSKKLVSASPTELPSLLWLVRDFALELKVNNRPISTRDYLELALQPATTHTANSEGKNDIRKAITQIFPIRDCFTMKRPVTNEQELQHINTLTTAQLRPEFVSDMKRLKKVIHTMAKNKTCCGYQINGPSLLGLAREYVEAINNDAIPMLKSSWENVVVAQCDKALAAAKKAYTEAMSASGNTNSTTNGVREEDEIYKTHQRATVAALALLKSVSVVSDDSVLALYSAQLHTFIDDSLVAIVDENKKKSKTLCESLAAKYFSLDAMTVDSTSGDNIIDSLADYFQTAKTKYETMAGGPYKHSVFAEASCAFLLKQARLLATAEAARIRTEMEKEKKAEVTRLTAEYDRIDARCKNVSKEWETTKTELQDLRVVNADLVNKLIKAANWM